MANVLPVAVLGFRPHRVPRGFTRTSLRCFAAESHASSTVLTHRTVLSLENQRRCQASLQSVAGRVKLKPFWSSGKSLEDMRQAGVLVPLCTVGGEPSVLLTLRSKNMSGYSGDVSFPGGMLDEAEDKDIVDTALREMHEEIGIERTRVNVWGRMTTVPGKGFELAVTPVIGFCGELDLQTLHINHDEVLEAFSCTIESLCLPANARYTTFRGASRYTMPAFDGQKHRIWGLSAIVLHRTLQLIAPGLYTPSIDLLTVRGQRF